MPLAAPFAHDLPLALLLLGVRRAQQRRRLDVAALLGPHRRVATASKMSTAAPSERRKRTIGVWPPIAAIISAVRP